MDKIFLNKEIIKVSESDYDYRNYKIYKLKKSLICLVYMLCCG